MNKISQTNKSFEKVLITSEVSIVCCAPVEAEGLHLLRPKAP